MFGLGKIANACRKIGSIAVDAAKGFAEGGALGAALSALQQIPVVQSLLAKVEKSLGRIPFARTALGVLLQRYAGNPPALAKLELLKSELDAIAGSAPKLAGDLAAEKLALKRYTDPAILRRIERHVSSQNSHALLGEFPTLAADIDRQLSVSQQLVHKANALDTQMDRWMAKLKLFEIDHPLTRAQADQPPRLSQLVTPSHGWPHAGNGEELTIIRG